MLPNLGEVLLPVLRQIYAANVGGGYAANAGRGLAKGEKTSTRFFRQWLGRGYAANDYKSGWHGNMLSATTPVKWPL